MIPVLLKLCHCGCKMTVQLQYSPHIYLFKYKQEYVLLLHWLICLLLVWIYEFLLFCNSSFFFFKFLAVQVLCAGSSYRVGELLLFSCGCAGFSPWWSTGSCCGARLQALSGFSSCGSWTQCKLRHCGTWGLVAPQHVESSQTRVPTPCVPHWQADSQLLDHQGSPLALIWMEGIWIWGNYCDEHCWQRFSPSIKYVGHFYKGSRVQE